MDNQNTATNDAVFLPPPIDGEQASAPLALPDDDFVMSLSTAGTPNTPADDGGTGSTASPVTPIHLNRQQHSAMTMDDDQTAVENGATDESAGLLLPPPDGMGNDEKNDATDVPAKKDDGDEDVPVLAMSGILPTMATGGGGGGGGTDDSKKNTSGDPSGGGGGGGIVNGDNKSKDKLRYTSSSGTGTGTEAEDSGTNNSQAAMGCGTTLEYVILITTCTILLLTVTGTTVYWTVAYRGGYDPNWFPWPPQTPKQLLSVGIFTYKQPQNFTAGGGDGDLTTTVMTTTSTEQPGINNSSLTISIEDRRFNLHPTLMTAGFITLTGFSILVYRMAAGCSTSCRGTYVKLTHGLLHLATVPCVVLGAIASMEYHRLKGLPHLYSLHSWMGLLTVSLFVIQFTLGLFTFVVLLCCRGATAACRLRCFAPIHATLGLCTFTLAIATCLTGLQQRADFTIFRNNGQQKQHQQFPSSSIPAGHLYHRENSTLPPQHEDIIINVIGILSMITLVFVMTALLLMKKITERNNSFPDTTIRYCRNNGQTFQLIQSPAETIQTNGIDHSGRNDRIGGEPTMSELIKHKLNLNKEPIVINVLAVLLVSVLVIVSYTVRRESIKRRPNNKPSYTATVSPLRGKSSSSSSTGKFTSGKQQSQLPV